MMSIFESFPEQKSEDKVPDEVTLRFRLPDGSKVERFFSKDTAIQTLYDFAVSRIKQNRAITLKTQYPNLVLDDVQKSISECQLEDMTTVTVSFK